MHQVHTRVLDFVADPGRDSFDDLALAVFRHQFEAILPYQSFCRSRGCTPETVSHWHGIPPVPVQAFKEVDLACGPPERIFRSTGTTQGEARRSRHVLPDLSLYHRAAVEGLRRFLFPDVARLRILSLIAPVTAASDSSLAQMAAWAIDAFGADGSMYVAAATGADFDDLAAALRACERSGEPCCLMTTTAALIRVLDTARERGLAFRLPHGSRLMDTGGAKGAPRRLSRNGLLHACWSAFALPGYFVVNEYGMCELSSQFYDNVLAERRAGRFRRRYKVGPPWARTRVLDPATLVEVAPGAIGLLCHVDLANAGSAVAVLTEDLGCATDDGFEVLGRAAGAETRGCSLSLAEWEQGAQPSR